MLTLPNESVDEVFRDAVTASLRLTVEPGLRGEENMRRDEENARCLVDDPSNNGVFVRLYGWNPWCLSLGANQKEMDIDVSKLQGKGYELVRRATGGRAVFHANELTYSIVMRLQQGLQVQHVYRRSHELLRDALLRIGAEGIEFSKSTPNFAQRYRTAGDSVSCFTSAARSEIMWKERKVVGSAQRVWGNVLLQHGSILLGRGHEELSDFVLLHDEEARQRLRESIERQSVSIEQICSRVVSFEECANAIVSVFEAL